MKNKKGFTLVELLVVVVILGIISVMAFPLIRGIVSKNELKKYEVYAESMSDATKLYVDSFDKDLFGNYQSGCAFVTWKDLNSKDLIKDIDIDKVSCNSDNSFVKVVKLRDKYMYAPYLACGKDNKGSAKNVLVSLPDKNKVYSMDDFVCNGVDGASISITAKPERDGEKFDKKIRSTKLVITSPTGINPYHDIFYSFSTSKDFNSITNWTKAKFKIPSNQEEKIESGEVIAARSETIQTPFGNGDYYLLVRVETLKDYVGRDFINPLNPMSNEFVYGPFKIDNEKPVIEDVKVVSKNSKYNSLDVEVNVTAVDNLTSNGDLLLCVSTSKCGEKDYKKYSSKVGLKLPGSLDGVQRKIYVGVKDLIGGIDTKVVNYTPYKECSSLKDDGWTNVGSCSKACGPGVQKQELKKTDKFTNKQCNVERREIQCNLGDCCSSTYKKNTEVVQNWSSCSKKCGTGTRSRTVKDNYYSSIDKSVFCSSKNRTETEKCNETACCSSTYKKSTEVLQNWSSCSKKCDTGTRSRTVKDNYYSSIDTNVFCSSKNRTETENCNQTACCSSTYIKNTDVVTNWGACSKSCGPGTKTRTVRDNYYSSIDTNVFCSSKNRTESTGCNLKDCCTDYAYGGRACWTFASQVLGDGNRWKELQVCKGKGSGCVAATEARCNLMGGTYHYFRIC